MPLTNLTQTNTQARIEIKDPYVLSIANRILHTMQLATLKAIAHNVDPESFKISNNSKSFERIALSYVRSRSKRKQEEAGKKVFSLLSLPLTEREKTFGELARVDLRSPMAIEEQVHALSMPANFRWPLRHEETLQLINNRIMSVHSSQKRMMSYNPIAEKLLVSKPESGAVSKMYSSVVLPSSDKKSWADSYRSVKINVVDAAKKYLADLIGDKYKELGGEQGVLGKPIKEEMWLGGGVAGKKRDYEHGSIYWSPSTDAHEMRSQIRDKWISLGGEKSFLGFPISDTMVSGIFHSDVIPDKPGLYNHFENGAIYWSEKTGAHEVHGAILQKWEEKGAERNFGVGYPISDEMETPDKNGRYSHFENGSIYYTQGTGACIVGGKIRDKWASLGWERSFLGYPTSDSTQVDGYGFGGYINPGYCNHFEYGSIYATLSGEAYVIYGAIRDKWASLGWEKSFLGFPVTDELGTPSYNGRYNHFQGGSIYWTPDTGAQEVHGAIRDKWASLGWENSYLGFPLTDECTTPDTIGRYNHFQGGSIYLTPDTGAQAVHIKVRETWESRGWEQSPLGYPLSSSSINSTEISNDFQGGFIHWTAASGGEVGTPYRHINFKIESLHCDVETPGIGSDEMIISGVGTDEYLNPYLAGTISQDESDSGDHFPINRYLVGFPLDKPGWPKAFITTILLAEDEGSEGLGELSGIQKQVMDFLKSEITKSLTEASVSGVGALIGAGLGVLGGPLGLVLGAVAGWVVTEFFVWIGNFLEDQWFIPAVSTFILPSVHTRWEGSSATPLQRFDFDRVDGGTGHYHIAAGWELINP